MTYKTLHSYIILCRLYGWVPSMAGLLAYEWQITRGMRLLWTGGELVTQRAIAAEVHQKTALATQCKGRHKKNIKVILTDRTVKVNV